VNVNVKNIFNGANICVKMNADENKQFLAKNDNGLEKQQPYDEIPQYFVKMAS
jgi:hypothetical protein